MLLVIDVGNTTINLGLYDDTELIANWRLTSTKNRTADEYGVLIHSLFDLEYIDPSDVEDVIIASVVPNIMYSLTHTFRKYFDLQPIIVEAGMKTGINLRMENPKELGADRIVSMVAAYEIYGGPVLVVDYGTATTFDYVSAQGEFLTGITAPGIQICADALFSRAALLPTTELKRPPNIVVKNTAASIQAGLIYGHIGTTIYIKKALQREMGLSELKVVATGGHAALIDDSNEIFDVLDPLLPLKGLRILYYKNKRR
ncbi:MAG: type III pantothenate kinase [Firmicutes bacterium]|nr:type III pantothenate kinase [Bacillota bacterium]